MFDNLGRPARILLFGGTSEIGLAIIAALKAPADTQVLLAGRDEARMAAAGKELPFNAVGIEFDALDLEAHKAVIDKVFADGPVDLVIAATGILTPQADVDANPILGARMIEVNFTSHVTTVLEAVARMKAQRHGTIVVLSSIAAVRPRKANFVYGAAKAGLDAFARGLTDALDGTGVRLLLVRPGFVIGRMTAGMTAAPLSSTPAQVGAAVAAALEGSASQVWVPRSLSVLATVLRMVPRSMWRRMRR
ncbi:MAG TPA: SDR family NAD(P)-dependent oxidoreductase [Streptosporangiaceae bacterium]|nr:SDR family NAD(P)-dependent oxidoreductase [Streptosporangiaceae bacterium]